MSYKGLIFDFDYTLGDSTEGIVASVNYALQEMGYAPAGREAVRATVGLHLEEIFRVLTAQKEAPAKEAEFSRLFRKKADQVMTESSSFYPGALELLKNWKRQGRKLAVVTTKYHYRIDAILEKYQAAGLFDLIVGGEDVKHPKPDPEGVRKTLEFLGIPKEQALYVGDSLVDAKTAQAAGVDFAGVTTGTTTKEELQAYPHTGIFAALQELEI